MLRFGPVNELPQGNYLHSFKKHEIKRQRHFKLMEMEYDIINNEISRMECVECNDSTGRNVMDVYYI